MTRKGQSVYRTLRIIIYAFYTHLMYIPFSPFIFISASLDLRAYRHLNYAPQTREPKTFWNALKSKKCNLKHCTEINRSFNSFYASFFWLSTRSRSVFQFRKTREADKNKILLFDWLKFLYILWCSAVISFKSRISLEKIYWAQRDPLILNYEWCLMTNENATQRKKKLLHKGSTLRLIVKR